MTVLRAEEKEVYDPTGGVAYHKCCEMLGIVPVSHFLRNLQDKDTAISLKYHGLGPKGAKAISVALTVRHFRLLEHYLMACGFLDVV